MTVSLDASTPCADHYHVAVSLAAVGPSPAQAPNTQAFVERFIGSIRRECLNHFVLFGAKHLDRVAQSWLEHYHIERPHQGRENELLVDRRRRKSPLLPTRRRSRFATSVAVSG